MTNNSPRKRMALVTSYNELCGNATYSHVLAEGFRKHYDVDIIPLNLRILRRTGHAYIPIGNRHIKDIANKLRDFDYVNIQFEAGLFAANPKLVFERISWLLDACRNVILTMHRIDTEEAEQPLWKLMLKALYKRDARLLLQARHAQKHIHLYARVINYVKKAKGRVNIMVHTKREIETLKTLFDCKYAYDFPITFLSKEKREAVYALSRDGVLQREWNLPPHAKVMGVFGFLSPYKSFETAVRALEQLPPEWVLLVFGSLHPQGTPYEKTDTYLDKLLADINLKSVAVWGKPAKEQEIMKVNSVLKDRVKFCGNLDDEAFISAMRRCDAVAIPYLECGQSMSGIAALAIETKSNAIFSNNLSFRELHSYYRHCIVQFDVGNHNELAQRALDISHRMQTLSPAIDKALETYNIENNINHHCTIFEKRVSV